MNSLSEPLPNDVAALRAMLVAARAERDAETRRSGRGSLPEHLPKVELVIAPQTTVCRCCGGAMQMIGEDRSSRPGVILRAFSPRT